MSAIVPEDILNDAIRLEAYFMAGLNDATRLRRRLEGLYPSASTSGLTAEQKADLIAVRSKKLFGKKKQ